jgi:glycosyltransferase involved in cell wall biosynthesis
VLGEWHKLRLRAQLRLPETFPIEFIPDGGDEPAEHLDTSEARRRLGISYGGPVVLFFGMLRRDKGIEDLLRAAAQVREHDFRLVIAGSPMEYTETQIRGLVEKAGIADKTVLRLKYIAEEDVPLYFFGCDALVLSYAGSYRGGSGPLMKGACTYGRPVIASDVSEMGRLVREHGLGVLATPGSSESLAAAIRQFLQLPDEVRAEMGRRAVALARANTWDAMAERFTSLFARIIERPARSPDV